MKQFEIKLGCFKCYSHGAQLILDVKEDTLSFTY